MSTETTVVGWIGVGAMGLPICANLVKGGVDVIALDRRPERTALAAEAGARAATSTAQLVTGSDIIFSMVYDDAALEVLLSGADGVLASILPGTLFIDMSTVSPAVSAWAAGMLAKNGVRYLRAPVSGSVPLAQDGTLAVMASGKRSDFEDCLPVLRLFSSLQTYVGEGEAARVIKLVINMMVVNATALIGEALSFGERSGVPRETLVDAINSSIVGSRHYQSRADGLKNRRYTSAGPVSMAAKDVDMVLAIARNQALSLPLTSYIRQYVTQMIHEGKGDLEVTALAEFPLRSAGLI